MGDDNRCRMLVRQWRILILLRRRQRTIRELAALLHVCERTARRDLYALSRVFPLTRASADDSGPWMLAEMAEWPRGETVPTKELTA